MFGFLKKKLRKKIVVAIAVPYKKDSFLSAYERGDSDLIKTLSVLYKTNDCEILWDKYSTTAYTIKSSLRSYTERGVKVVDDFTIEKFHTIADVDIAIIIAHHSNVADKIEMADRMVFVNDFVNSVPLEFSGILDMSSCYSTTSQLYIKMRCPQSHIVAYKTKISLKQRMFVYDYVIKTICDKSDKDYIDATKDAFAILFSMQKQVGSVNDEIVYLGGEIQSSVFAPKQVEKGQPFLIQLAIHKSSDADTVEIMAREADGSTSLRNPLRLKLKLKKEDKVDLAINIDSVEKDDFILKKSRDFFYWQNEPVFKSYTVFVSDKCNSQKCVVTIKINVNKMPAGSITFVSEVTETPAKTEMVADIFMKRYDKNQEMNEAKAFLLNQMRAELNNLSEQRDIEICKNSIKLLEEKQMTMRENTVFKVFISSTSDLANFRNVMKERVLSCSMYPEMYESWPQKEKYPRDYCIEKVLNADIFVCILGPNYGYVEPTINTSMTEIEFRVAMLAGKPILVYVWDEYEEKMLTYIPEHQAEVEKQKALIKELNTKRMVELFKDEIGLALISNRELTLIQKELEYEGSIKG